jgi:hypothetical protein
MISKSLLRFFFVAGFCFLALFINDKSIMQKAFAEYDLPIRVIARADVSQLQYNRYAVYECLDVYNDDYNKPLLVNAITADTWIGHKKDLINENWQDGRRIIEVPPASVVRVAERKRVVTGKWKRDWWVRWIRFNLVTNRGFFVSNFVSSPFKPPGNREVNIHQRRIDTLMEPIELTPTQKIIRGTGK